MHKVLFILLGLQSLIACGNTHPKEAKITNTHNMETITPPTDNANLDTITLGAGCFWCVEAVYQQIKGVISVTSGYSGGKIKNPSYKEVCQGTTGHAEVCQVVYNTKEVATKDILEAFFLSHDPTTLNSQGNDFGTQYRSAIFYHNAEQKGIAESVIKELNETKAYDNPVVTEVSPFTVFYKAEDYHQNYYNQNGNQPYCQFVISPKLDKFKKAFDKVKK